jgi:hypothetical protein
MKLAIMQPYFFPYIGYFQLIKAVDKFIFYDDVHYIKNGWINRNRILLNGKAHFFTVHQKDASPNKLINEVEIIDNRSKLKKTLLSAYSRAPHFREVWPLMEDVLGFETNNISELAEYSIIKTYQYLGLDIKFELSSRHYSQTANLKKEDRLIAICNINDAQEYINPIGGLDLYDRETFIKANINLSFLKSGQIIYRQFGISFVGNLSIIDVLMFNNRESIHLFLDTFDLI